MIFSLFRRNPNEARIARLHGELMAQAREPALFLDYGVADTPEGRFEMVAIHVLMALRRLNELPDAGPALAQDLTDAMFRHFDIAFREMGVSDTTVPKRMKKYASAWLGRARAYGAAIDRSDLEGLTEALARNVYGSADPGLPQAARMARYIFALREAHAGAPFESYLDGPVPACPPLSIA